MDAETRAGTCGNFKHKGIVWDWVMYESLLNEDCNRELEGRVLYYMAAVLGGLLGLLAQDFPRGCRERWDAVAVAFRCRERRRRSTR